MEYAKMQLNAYERLHLEQVIAGMYSGYLNEWPELKRIFVENEYDVSGTEQYKEVRRMSIELLEKYIEEEFKK